MKIKIAFALFLGLGISGCVTMTPKAAKIMLHSQISTQLDGCTKLGPVSGEASGWKNLDWASVEQQAKNNLRDNAVKKFGDRVDSVAVINIDRYSTKVVANGLAFKCF